MNEKHQIQQDKSGDKYSRIILRHYELLKDRMSPEFGLADRLYSKDTLSDLQKNEIDAESVSEKKNEILLRYIIQKNACKELYIALGHKKYRQSHLVKYMKENGDYRPDFDGNWPLKEEETKILKNNYETLIDKLDCSGLAGQLYSTEVLNTRQLDLIFSKKNTIEQNKVLLEILRKGSLGGYRKTIECLHESKQSHIANKLEPGGDVVSCLSSEVSSLADSCTKSENSKSLEHVSCLSMNLEGDYDTDSPSNNFPCPEPGDIESFEQVASGSHLKKRVVEESFNSFPELPQSTKEKPYSSENIRDVVRMGTSLPSDLSNLIKNCIKTENTKSLQNLDVSSPLMKWPQYLEGEADIDNISVYTNCPELDEIASPKQISSGDQLNRHTELPLRTREKLYSIANDHSRKTTIECLPLEIIDIILQYVYLRCRQQRDVSYVDNDSGLIVFLASVNSIWFQRIQRRRFKRAIWPQLQRIYRKELEMYLNFRGCLRYLIQAMQVEEVRLTRKELVAADFLTDLQVTQLQGKKLTKGKRQRRLGMLAPMMEEILKVRRGPEEESIYNNFIRCLRQNRQANEARVLEQEGSTAKVRIRQPKNRNRDAWSREFSSSISNLKEKNQLKSADIEKIIQQLADSDLEILDSFVDRDVSVRIWCKSQNALETLKDLYKSQTLVDHLYQLGNERDRIRSTKDIHLEEYSQLKIDTISLRNMVINFEGKIQMEHTMDAIGVSKLRNKFLSLSLSNSPSTARNLVHGFDDQHPFNLQWKKPLKEIKYASDIVPFEDFCLYIADIRAKCIWKILAADENKIEDGEFTCIALPCPKLKEFGLNDFRMAITERGQIMFVDSKKSIFLFCESESALDCPIRINLPAAIEQPQHVAENSAGNFIFLHRAPRNVPLCESDRVLNHKIPWAVSEVGRNGKTIIRQHLGTGDQWLNPGGSPSLLIDPSDRIFLLDTWSHRLILLDSRLRYVRSYTLGIDGKMGENQLLFPRNMFFDGGKNQLIVSGQNGAMIYSIRRY